MTENRPVAAAVGADSWRLNVLGPVELCYDGAPVEVAGQTRTLLALLAQSPCEEVGTASIVAGMWGAEPPEDAEKEVASHVSRLRKALTAVAPDVNPTSVVVTLPAGYILAVQPSNADILAFERLAADGRRAIAVGQPGLALARLDAALALWRGRAYEDFGAHAFARAEANRLEDLRLAVVESRVDARLALAAPSASAELVTELQTLLAEHWHRERLWAQLMIALFRLGRRADALAACRRAQELLAQALHAQPGAELRAVERAVIDADPALCGRAPQPGTVPAALATTVPACVGRDEEVAWLCDAIDLAATRRAQVRLVVGSPGIGKTRLVCEVAQRAAERGVRVHHWRGHASGMDTLVAEPDRVSLLVVEDLDQAPHEDVVRVVNFVSTAAAHAVVTLVTCRDPVRVADLQGVPKLVLSALDDAAVTAIVRTYAPSVADATAVAAMVNAGGVPARVHRAASEWAFARAGRRIDRAVADAVEPRRAVTSLQAEIVAGALELAHVRAKARLLRPVVRTVGCPYPGLAGFTTADAEIFHGRERLVAEVLARLTAAPLLALVGEPGSGKSSLVRAGLLPAISAGVLPDSASWRHVVVTPSAVDSLADLLADAARAEPDAARAGPDAARAGPDAVPTFPPEPAGAAPDGSETVTSGTDASLEATAPASTAPAATAETIAPAATAETTVDAATDTSLDAALSAVADSAEPRPVPGAAASAGPPLLVVDQFEEAFTILDADRRTRFLDALVRATDAGRVVVVVRAQFYPWCAEDPRLARLVCANTVLMPGMAEEELRRAIERPASAAGLQVESGLVNRLVAEVEDGRGGLPQLATTLRALWQGRTGPTLTLADYLAGPDLADAIEAYAEEAFAALATPAAREAGRAILLGLARYTEHGVAVRRRASVSELLAPAGPAGLPALETLTEHGLVTLSADVGEAELVHDCLVSQWPRLREWLTEQTEDAGLRRHLARAANVWAAGGRDPARLYQGARLATVLDWAERYGAQLTANEREFLAAANRVVLAAEIRRRRRSLLLWKWLAAMIGVAILAVAVAVVAVTLQLRGTARAERADAARLAAAAANEPDLRLSALLAVAAVRLDPDSVSTVAGVLQRAPELIAAAGEGVQTVVLSPDGRTLAAGSLGGTILLLHPDTLAVSARLSLPGYAPVNGLAFTADGRRLVSWGGAAGPTGTADGAGIVVWDVASGKPDGPAFGQLEPGGGGLLADRSTLVLAQRGSGPGSAATVAMWSIDSRTPSTAYPMPTTDVDSVVVSPDGRLVALGTAAGIVVVAPQSGEIRSVPTVHRPLAISTDGATLLAAGGDTVRAISLETLRPSVDGGGQGHRGEVLGAAWAPDGGSFATVGADGAVIIWDARALRPVRTLVGEQSAVRTVTYGANGGTLYTVGDDGAVLAWDLTGGRGVGARLAADPASAVALACALAGRELTVKEWQRFLPDRGYERVCAG